MSLSNRITRCPIPYDADHGHDARALVPWADAALADLIAGTAGCSPYLRGLLRHEGAWLETAALRPEQALRDLLPDLVADIDPHSGPRASADLAVALRRAKRRAALLIALADLGGVWDLDQVTGALTALADAAAGLAFDAAVADQVRRRKLPAFATAADAGLVAFAMGKMGAAELNYSSDIDLIVLFDETRHDPADFADIRAGLVRATRAAAALLNDVTAQGYVFRTDLRLRPDPAVTPVCLAMEAAERYYESLGRTWERAAWIKARPCVGDLEAGARFQRVLRPFIWRRHLDFAAIEDAHNMRLAIRAHKGTGGPLSLERHNMKLGRGGIREIEFFTQTRQLIAGGRDPDLRMPGTQPALAALATRGWVPQDVATTLTQRYRQHREVEHRLQMLNDAQTHDLPATDAGFDRLAAFMGTDTVTLRRDLTARLLEVHTLTEDFFAPGAAPATTPEDDETDLTRRWLSYPALRSSRAVELFKRLKPDILRRLKRAAKPDEALVAFDGFLQGLPAGVQVFSLFEANRHLVDLLIDIVVVSPDLARYLSRNAVVFDAVIGGGFFDPWPGREALLQDLSAQLRDDPDYEHMLIAARRWKREWHFRVGVHLLRGLISPEDARAHYGDVAHVVLTALWPVVQAQFARRHGPAPGHGAVVLGMGSLGTGRLHARSDLDMIVIYDADGANMSDGPRPLATRPYYARLTQALITALSAPMAEGRLYEVDMRLRPSGNQGPVATSLAAFREYQHDKAWAWEHLALTRARVVAGPDNVAHDVEAVCTQVLGRTRDVHALLTEVAQMRARIATAKSPEGPLDPKIGAGRMQDIELLAQAGALVHPDHAGVSDGAHAPQSVDQGLQAAQAMGWVTPAQVAKLSAAYGDWSALQVAVRLLGDDVPQPDDLSQAARAFLARSFALDDTDALLDRLSAHATAAATTIDATLPSS